MTKIKYNEKQIGEINSNQNVKNTTSKHIVFSKTFKEEAVKLAKKYITAKEIFKHFGFPAYVTDSDTPKNSLNRWKKLSQKGVIEEKKGRPKKEKTLSFDKMSLKEQNEYLRTENLYLKELHRKIYGEYP